MSSKNTKDMLNLDFDKGCEPYIKQFTRYIVNSVSQSMEDASVESQSHVIDGILQKLNKIYLNGDTFTIDTANHVIGLILKDYGVSDVQLADIELVPEDYFDLGYFDMPDKDIEP